MDASNLLKPALASGTLRCIGSTTYKEYRNYFEKDRALVRRFQKIDVNEPSLRSEEHTSELQSLMRISYAVFCLKKKKSHNTPKITSHHEHKQTHYTLDLTKSV